MYVVPWTIGWLPSVPVWGSRGWIAEERGFQHFQNFFIYFFYLYFAKIYGPFEICRTIHLLS
jgi:hypothetical protein